MIHPKKPKHSGFTLIELIVVVGIIGIIAAIGVLNLGGIVSGAQSDADIATARTILNAVHMAESEAGNATVDETLLNKQLSFDALVKITTIDSVPLTGWAVAKDETQWYIFKNQRKIYP